MPYCLPQIVISLFTFLSCSVAFEFKSPTVTAMPLTINTPAQYLFYIQRQYTQNVQPTPYNTELVPAGSKIIA